MSETNYHSTEADQVCPVSGETRREEQINYFTHLIGFLLSVIGGGALIWTSFSGDIWNVLSCSVYSAALIGLYAASTFYHRCELVPRKKHGKLSTTPLSICLSPEVTRPLP